MYGYYNDYNMGMPSESEMRYFERKYPRGTRIKLYEMINEPQMPYGLEGTVVCVDAIGQLVMEWDNGSCLSLDIRNDRFVKVNKE